MSRQSDRQTNGQTKRQMDRERERDRAVQVGVTARGRGIDRLDLTAELTMKKAVGTAILN